MLSLLPMSFRRARIDGPGCPPTDTKDNTNAKSVLSRPSWLCCHRMCVIAKGTGLSPHARTCSRTWSFLKRLQTSKRTHFPLLETVHVRHLDPQIGEHYPSTLLSMMCVCVFQRECHAPPGDFQPTGSTGRLTEPGNNASEKYFGRGLAVAACEKRPRPRASGGNGM